MGVNSNIQWTGNTWNPWHGCKKVSAGCKYCYMYRDKIKYGQDPTNVVRSKTKFYDPLKWIEPQLVFTCSWSDWFIDEADEWRDEAWNIIRKTPHITYQILTKRPDRILDHLPADWGDGYTNVWIGISVEDQKSANERIPLLLNVPAKVRFLSCEPLLENIDLRLHEKWCKIPDQDYHVDCDIKADHLHWIIIGGESGNDNGEYKYRECDYRWIVDIINQGFDNNISVFVKQLGTFISKKEGYKDRHGGDIDEWPSYLCLRQFPKNTSYAPINR